MTKNKMKKKQIIFYILFFIILGFILSSIYRPYIYSNNINDFGIADVGNNIIFIPAVYFLTILIKKRPIFGVLNDIYFHTSALIIIEILSFFIKGIGTFDYKDILGLTIGAFLTLILVRNRKINLINDKMEFDLRN
jgi:hypothetical protein